MRPFRLPGGDRAGREPWRAAAALAWEAGIPWTGAPTSSELAHQAWTRALNCPRTSAVGRIFDAAAALAGLLTHASFEGQGPMYLEARCEKPGCALDLPLTRDVAGTWITDWAPLVAYMQETSLPLAERAANFHASLAQALLEQAQRVRAEYGVTLIGFAGGVFQNRVLTERAEELLVQAGFTVFIPNQSPVNDAAIAFGQVVEGISR
jgi:hydrogenase maturation protein HypF